MNLLGAKLYDPAAAVSKATSSLLAITAFDTTNLRLTVTVPAHGMLMFKIKTNLSGATTMPQVLLGVLNGATVVGRQVALAALPGTALATTNVPIFAEFIATGLTPGSASFDAAYGVETLVAATNIHYGGPNNTTANDAWGAFGFEIWDPQSQTTTGQLSVDANGRMDVIKVAGTTQTARDIGASVLLSSGTGTGQLKLASGYVAMTWADIAAPTTTLALTGTTIATTQKVDVETIKTNPVVNAGTITFPTTATLASTTNITAGTIATVTAVTTVNGLAAGVITAASIAADAITDAKVASDVTIASVIGAVGSVTGNVGGNVSGNVVGSVASVTAAIVLPTIPTDWITAAGIATDAFGALELAAGAGSEIATAVRTELATELARIDVATSTRGTSTLTQTQVTGGAYSIQSASAVLGDARIANLDATVSSRLATAGYTAPSNLTTAQIATGVWTDTVAGDFTTVLSVGKSIMNGVTLGTGLTVASVSGAVDSVTGAVGSVTGSVGSIATGGIAATSFAAGAIDAAAIATDAIGSAEISAAAVTKIQTGLATPTNITAATGITVATNSDKTGYSLLATTGLGDQTANITGNLSGSVGSVTGLTASNLDATISSRMASYTQPTGFLAASFPTDPADQSLIIAATDAILASVALRSTPAQVNTEVLDVLNVDTFAELSAPPAATSSLRDKLTWVFMWARNKATQTSTQRKLYADDTTTVVGTETVSDDGTTYSKSEAS